MATKTWLGGAGTWDNAANWSPQGVPGVSDDAVIGASADVSVSGLVQVGSISLAGPTAVLELRAANSSIFGSAPFPPGSRMGGGIVRFGSSDASQPASLAGFGNLTLDTNLSLDVIGSASLGSGHTPFQPYQVTLAADATINVALGGTLAFRGFFSGTGAIHVASGTLDLSEQYARYASNLSANPPIPVKMDDNAGTVVLGVDSSVTVQGFRAGDVLDFRNFKPPFGPLGIPAYPPGPFQAQVNGDQLQVSSNGTVIRSVTLVGPQAPGATYQAVLSGANDILVTTTAQPAATVAFADQTTGASGSHAMDAASGGPDYLQWQYLDAGSDTVAMTASLPNVFLKGGAGTKALAVSSGQNVLDGGTGSAFLTGGTGNNTFFVDVRGTAQVWDTLANFGAGDALTVWGWSPGSGTETVDALDGAAGSQGATLRLANAQGGPVSSVTFAGLSADQVARLQTSTGTAGGLSYLYVSAPGA